MKKISEVIVQCNISTDTTAIMNELGCFRLSIEVPPELLTSSNLIYGGLTSSSA